MRPLCRDAAAGTVAFTLFIGVSFAGSGRWGPGDPADAAEAEPGSSLEQFGSCEDIEAWADDELAPRVGPYGFELPQPVPEEAGEDEAFDGDVARPSAPEAQDEVAMDAAAPGGAPEYSETNVQVEGIDEPDIVKTDGERILAVADGRLHLASPDGAEVLSTVDLPEGLDAGEMMLAGDRVLLFGMGSFEVFDEVRGVPEGSTRSPDAADADMPWWPGTGTPGTSVAQVDIVGDELQRSDTFALEGSYLSARMIDGVVRLVMHTDGGDRFPFVQPGRPTERAEALATQVNQGLVEDAAGEDFLPRWARLDTQGQALDDGVLLGCEQAYAPEDFAGFGMVSVVTIDVSAGAARGISSSDGAGVMADGDTVYASHENLYVASPEWVQWDTLTSEEVSEAERNFGTDIHRFSISDPTQVAYDRSGRVDGSLLNQFALDEHDGYLRVATTTGSPWAWDGNPSESHVSVLAPTDQGFLKVGSVSGLGKGETIRSVRFMGDTGYVVTFRQTDPLYTIDLSDPAHPQEKGELKILGYSAYLHPIDDGWLLGVGQDATEEGRVEGTQLSLFDVRDLENPTRVAQATLPNVDSAAEADHHAFLWWADTQLAAIPVSTNWRSDDSFEGLVGFTVDTEGQQITEFGRISHPEQEVDDWGWGRPMPLPAEPDADGLIAPPQMRTPSIERSWIIGEQIWTLSDAGLASTDLETFEDTAFIPFPEA